MAGDGQTQIGLAPPSGLRLLCRPQTAPGFALAGLRVEEVLPQEVDRRLADLLSGGEAGVILIDEELLAQASPERHAGIARQPFPVVIPFPGPRWEAAPSAAEAYITEILRQAVGYQMRLR